MNKLIVINNKPIHIWISFFFPKEEKRVHVDSFSHFTCEVRRNEHLPHSTSRQTEVQAPQGIDLKYTSCSFQEVLEEAWSLDPTVQSYWHGP